MGHGASIRPWFDADAILTRLARVQPRGFWHRVLIGVAAAAAMLAVRWFLSSFYGSLTGFMILLPAVVLAGLAGGRVAGFSAVAAALLGGWLVVGPSGVGVGVSTGLGRVATINFLIVGGFCAVVAASLRDSLAQRQGVLAELSASDARVGESEDRLRNIGDIAPVMLWTADLDGRTYLNAAFRAFWGDRPTGASSQHWIEAIHPDDRDRVVRASLEALQNRTPLDIEARYSNASGDWCTVQTRAMPRFSSKGVFVGMVGANIDVTDARAAEAAMRESEERFRLLADTAPSPVWLTNAEAEVEFVNEALVEFYGRPASDILGHVWKQAMHPDDIAEVAQIQKRARSKRQAYGFEARFLHASGEWRWMRVSVKPRFDGAGAFLGYVGMSFDISGARNAIEALARQERRQRFLLSLSDKLRDLSQPQEIIATVNRALAQELTADRVAYGDIDVARDEIEVRRSWKKVGMPETKGVWRLGDFGGDLIDQLRQGQVVHVSDIAADPRTASAAEAYGAKKTQALVCAPILRGGQLKALFYVHMASPREWRDDEVSLVQEVAVRAWAEIERTGAETVVRESESRFRDIADTAPVLIWVTQADRQRAFVNQAYVAFMGGDYESVRTADWRSYIHPDDQDRLVQESLAGEATGEPFSLEARYLRHDGEYRWLKSFSRPRIAEGGAVIGFVGVAFDVTDIRDTNARLRAAAAERDAILGQLAEGVVVTDPEGRIIFFNEAAVRAHGVDRLDVTPDDYSGAYSLFTEDGEIYPPHELPLARAVERGETVTDARWKILRPDGSEVVAIGNARPVVGPDGEQMGAVLTLRDETARIAAEHALAESEARFRTVADSAPALIWMADEGAQITFANRRYKTFFGVEADAVLGDRWRDLVHPEDVDIFAQAFLRAFETKDRFEAQVRVIHPSMGVRWLRCEGVARFNAAGVFQGYVGANLDVTEAKQAEEDLKRINELLEDRVGEALAEKAKAEADLMHAQRMEAVGRLTGGVAHDFNNLLTVVIGALDMMLRSDDPARRRKLAEAALSAARRGEGLTHQLLAFSRRQALRPVAGDLNALIREGEPLLRRAVGEAVEFKLKLKRGGVQVSVDAAQFEAALLNLVVNARDAVGDKGRVTIQTLDCEVEPGDVRELAPGRYVCVTVSDNGAGMSQDVMSRVFEPFFTTKAVGKGTGLGLSQVYGFARQSGGGVHITSTVGRGTEIRLYLPPLAPGQAATEEAPPERALEPVKGRRILLVEDDPSVSAVAIDLLLDMGLEVKAADTGPAALAVLKTQRFDLMLTDIVMPGGMTGIELGRQAARSWPDMKIVLTSGYAGDDVDQALADAPWPFLRKPYSIEQLRRQLGDSLALSDHDPD